MSNGLALHDDDRWPWLDEIATWIRQRSAAGAGAVVTCSALKRRYRDVLRADTAGVVFLCLTGEEVLLHARMSQRAQHFMPPQLLQSQLLDFEPLASYEAGLTVSCAQPLDAIVASAVSHLLS